MKGNYTQRIDLVDAFIKQAADAKTVCEAQDLRLKAIRELESLLNGIDVAEYLCLLDRKIDLPKQCYLDCHYNLATLYKSYVEIEIDNVLKKHRQNNTVYIIPPQYVDLFKKAIDSFFIILKVVIENEEVSNQIVNIFYQLAVHSQHDLKQSLDHLKKALLYVPESEEVNYNLGFAYQQLNQLDESFIHYRLAIQQCKSKIRKDGKYEEPQRKILLSCYNGLSVLLRAIDQQHAALQYLLKAQTIDDKDPDIQNQLGIVYTDMGRTDLAEIAYRKGIDNYTRSFISPDLTVLLSNLYLNLGHMHEYNGNNVKSVECFEKSLQNRPSFSLVFQSKLMGLCYLFDQLEDKMLIHNQHKLVNNLYKKSPGKYVHGKPFFSGNKINIGFVSGDLVDHPVSFLIRTFLNNYNPEQFNVTCYCERIIDTSIFNPNITFRFTKHMPAEEAATLIYNDNIHILFDLAGQTAYTRLDVFALKPAPIQITYLGYPFTSGLDEMDYRITDCICDHPVVSQPFYTEKLLFLDNCFLCYDPIVIRKKSEVVCHLKYPDLEPQPFLKNGYLTFGCYNRINKITDGVMNVYNQVMLQIPNARFVFKTRALLNKTIRTDFVNRFDKSVRDRVIIEDCTILQEQHLAEYNKIDISIDTFPYAGTLTSCEALTMGVPVFAFYDTKYFFHPQNVTVSLLKNSDLDYYVINHDENASETLISKIKELLNKDKSFWESLKETTRKQFLGGKVCNKDLYMKNISNLLVNLFEKHKNDITPS